MARSFTAASSEVLRVDSSPVTVAPWTICAWFNISTGSFQKVFGLGKTSGADSHRATIGINSSNSYQYAVSGTEGTVGVAAGTYAGGWTHMTAVETSASSREIYADGASLGTDSTTITPDTPNRIIIGARNDFGGFDEYANGTIAECAIWNAALTAAEVASLGSRAVSPLLIRPASLVFYAPLIRGKTSTGGDDSDIVGGLTLTDVNTVAVGDHPRMYYPRSGFVVPKATAAGGLSIPVAMHEYRRRRVA